MKKINIHEDLLQLLSNIVSNNEDSKTKVARTLISTTEGLDDISFLSDYSDYFNFAYDTKKSISYVKKDKMVEKLKKMDTSLSDVSDELLSTFNEKFYTTSVTRTRCKPSKFITRLFTKEYIKSNFSNKDVEHFVNQYTSIIRDEIDFQLVTGEDIRKYYHTENYDHTNSSGTLLSSCMQQASKQKFLDIYTKNKNVSMLVAFNDDKKVIGRSIIWNNVTFKERDTMDVIHKGVKFMDRIYYTSDWLVDKFLKWAKDRDIVTKYNQSHSDYYRFLNSKNKEKEMIVEINLDFIHFNYLPYLDTLIVPNYKKGFLTNKTDGYRDDTFLRSHDYGIPQMVWDNIEGKLVRSSDSEWVESTWVHVDDLLTVDSKKFHKKLCKKDRLGGFISPNDNEVKCVITNTYFAERNMVESELHNGLIHKKESVNTIDSGIVHQSKSVKSKYLNGMLSEEGSVYLKNMDDYLPKSILDSGVNVDEFEKVIQTLSELKGEEKVKVEESSTFVFEF